MRRTIVACAILLAACGSGSLEPLPFMVSMAATSSTPARGDSVTFTVNAQGGSLFGVQMSYGDGVEESFNTGGARTARVNFRHAFEAVGTYDVQATVTDASAGAKSASIAITVH